MTKDMRLSGEKIKRRRDELKLSRNALGKLMGVSRNAIYDWETSDNASYKKYGNALSVALKIGLADLLFEGVPYPGEQQTLSPDPAPKPPLYKHMDVDEKYLKDINIPDITAQFSPHNAIAHNKIIIIDRGAVITGSFNFTKAAEEKNAENLLLIRSDDLADIYRQNWIKHREYFGK